MQGGYAGKVLRVNLTAKTTAVEDLQEEIAIKYIGGAGFRVKYLLEEVSADVDALGPDNVIVIGAADCTL